MGVSTYCLIKAFWMCKTKMTPRGIIYWMPTDASVSDFVKTKVDTFIIENEEIAKSMKSSVRRPESNTQGLKFLYGTPLFFRGLRSRTNVKSISADAAFFDEFDEADPEQVVQARKRVSASFVKASIDLSTPTIPDFGIDKRFQETDQRHYCFKCPSCSKYNILEENWPNTFLQDKEGNYYPACRSCKGKLDLKSGTWFATVESKIRGYQISQLYSPFVSPNEIMQDYQSTDFMGHFYNHVLGLPYLSAEDRVTFDMIIGLCDGLRPMPSNYLKQTCMGVDVGSKLHTTIIDPQNNRVIWVGEPRQFEELETIMLKFNVKDVVIDALPETRKVREFIAKHKHKAWMCYYNDNQKGSYAWNEEERIVSVNRTESLDYGTLSIINKKISLPQRSPLIEEFSRHCASVVKIAEENKETGSIRHVYKKLAADHFRHSLNYAQIAASRTRSGNIVSVYR